MIAIFCASIAMLFSSMLVDFNDIRQRYGVPPVQWSMSATIVAQQRANDMAMTGHFSHYALDGSLVLEDLSAQACGSDWVQAGEIIAMSNMPSPWAAAVSKWEESIPHRGVIVGQYTHVGMGQAKSDDGLTYSVAIYCEEGRN